ncbi:hypothetical protein NDU88_001623 [Pleurodeles waltl]|uniref:Uncharacterized protein n=1 Tax=Pleurodeles waltl TaxID=8319 RepID=A0AAV7P4J4_PLEWA|nr:hypothetical protein NDU88_001623 [Pleurodeles waltl]
MPCRRWVKKRGENKALRTQIATAHLHYRKALYTQKREKEAKISVHTYEVIKSKGQRKFQLWVNKCSKQAQRATDTNIAPDKWEAHIELLYVEPAVPNTLPEPPTSHPVDTMKQSELDSEDPRLTAREVTPSQVLLSIKTLWAGGAPGPSAIPAAVYKWATTRWATVMAPLFQECRLGGIDSFEKALAQGISASGSPLCKIYERGNSTAVLPVSIKGDDEQPELKQGVSIKQ